MNGSRVSATLLMLCSGFVGLAACGDSAPEPQAKATTPTPSVPKLATPGENMVAAVPAGKSARFIGVHFSLGSVPTVKQALPVEIAIIPHQDFASLGVNFQSQDGLTVMSGDVMPPIKDAKAENPLKHQLAVMPVRTGVFVITATVATEGDDGSVTRVFSIPVIVAPPSAEAPPASAESAAAN